MDPALQDLSTGGVGHLKFEAALQPVQACLHGRDGSILRHFQV